MNESPAELLATIDALRIQLEETNKRLAALERAVKIQTGEDGCVRTHIECHTLAMRGTTEAKPLGFYMGVHKEKPFLHMFAQGTEKEVRILKLETDPQGECRLILNGRDGHTKALVKVHQGAGLFAAYTPGDKTGVIVQGHAGGGCVSLLHPLTEIPQAVLIHHTPIGDQPGSATTELAFQESPGQPRMRLFADAGLSSLMLGLKNSPAMVVCAAGDKIASLSAQCHSDDGGISSSLVAMPEVGRVFVGPVVPGSNGAEAALEIIQRQPSMLIKYGNGEIAIQAGIEGNTTAFSLNTDDGKQVFEINSHKDSVNSCTFFHGDGSQFHQLLSNAQSSSLRISALNNHELGLLTLTEGADSLHTTLHREQRVLLGFSSGEHGGVFTVTGCNEGDGGAVLAGGKYGGSLVFSNADSQAQAVLDTTDYGGRLNINNDLGFPRIVMGVYEESAGIHLNHTGQKGVSAVATPGGGVLMVHDSEGNLRDSVPRKEDIDEED